MVWIVKKETNCLAAFTCHKSRASNSWYFDSGCSRHMTDDANILTNFKSLKCGVVTFGDGMSGNIVGKGTLSLDGLPKLRNVLLVEGLKANLISVSQICDQGFKVNFSRDDCNFVDQNGMRVLKGYRSIDKCYTLSPSLTCHSAIGKIVRIRSDHEEIDKFIAETSQTESPIVTIGDVVPSYTEKVATEAEAVPTTSERSTKEGPEIITNSIQREPSTRIKKNHPLNIILGDIEESMVTRKSVGVCQANDRRVQNEHGR
ncbi:uncharacterized protein LOC133814611 [Humulus lupulus]|uniref:uncharacterized protein LOC133814611 n=1 Tax=Humulus lupulus TaxID=3486 RepID=UPI002B4162C6|nr:uncharacterized protein LOC133814611 [Humulus lupulus]